jgi:hypothetical protein
VQGILLLVLGVPLFFNLEETGKMKVKVVVLSLLLALPLIFGLGTSKALDYGEALDKLQAHAKSAAQQVTSASEPALDSLKHAKRKGSSAESDSTDLATFAKTAESNCQILRDDLRIIQAAGEALLERAQERTGSIRNSEIRAAQLERIKAAGQRFQSQLASAANSLRAVDLALEAVRDQVVVQQIGTDLSVLNEKAGLVRDITAKTQQLVAAIGSFANDNRELPTGS